MISTPHSPYTWNVHPPHFSIQMSGHFRVLEFPMHQLINPLAANIIHKKREVVMTEAIDDSRGFFKHGALAQLSDAGTHVVV